LGVLEVELFTALVVETVVLAPGCFLFLDCGADPFPFILRLAEKVDVPGIRSFAAGALLLTSGRVVLTAAKPRRGTLLLLLLLLLLVLVFFPRSAASNSAPAGGAAAFWGPDFAIFPFASIR